MFSGMFDLGYSKHPRLVNYPVLIDFPLESLWIQGIGQSGKPRPAARGLERPGLLELLFPDTLWWV